MLCSQICRCAWWRQKYDRLSFQKERSWRKRKLAAGSRVVCSHQQSSKRSRAWRRSAQRLSAVMWNPCSSPVWQVRACLLNLQMKLAFNTVLTFIFRCLRTSKDGRHQSRKTFKARVARSAVPSVKFPHSRWQTRLRAGRANNMLRRHSSCLDSCAKSMALPTRSPTFTECCTLAFWLRLRGKLQAPLYKIYNVSQEIIGEASPQHMSPHYPSPQGNGSRLHTAQVNSATYYF